MPIVVLGTRPVLVCANQEHPSHAATAKESTMEAAPGWHALLSVEPPREAWTPPNVNTFAPVKLYLCSLCGYVELYAGGVTAPETWRVGK